MIHVFNAARIREFQMDEEWIIYIYNLKIQGDQIEGPLYSFHRYNLSVISSLQLAWLWKAANYSSNILSPSSSCLLWSTSISDIKMHKGYNYQYSRLSISQNTCNCRTEYIFYPNTKYNVHLNASAPLKDQIRIKYMRLSMACEWKSSEKKQFSVT